MERDRRRRRPEYGAEGGRRRLWPRSRAAGCLLWVVLLVVLLVVLSVLFGGFQKGTQVKGLGPVGVRGSAAPAGLARPVAVAVAVERGA
jgi:hypothetical protein